MTTLADIQRHLGVTPDGVLGPVTLSAIGHAIGLGGITVNGGKELRVSQAGIDLIHRFEGYAKKLPDGRAQAYPDPATGGAPWTIGWGSTTDENGMPIKPGTVWTRERADARFRLHLAEFEAAVRKMVGDNATQNQFDALVSFAYNLGAESLRRSTLLRLHNEGDYAGAAAEFVRWNRAAGKVMAGLTRRREAEAKLYRGV